MDPLLNTCDSCTGACATIFSTSAVQISTTLSNTVNAINNASKAGLAEVVGRASSVGSQIFIRQKEDLIGSLAAIGCGLGRAGVTRNLNHLLRTQDGPIFT